MYLLNFKPKLKRLRCYWAVSESSDDYQMGKTIQALGLNGTLLFSKDAFLPFSEFLHAALLVYILIVLLQIGESVGRQSDRSRKAGARWCFQSEGTGAVLLAQGHSLYPWSETSPVWLHPFTPRPPPITENPYKGLPLAGEGLCCASCFLWPLPS